MKNKTLTLPWAATQVASGGGNQTAHPASGRGLEEETVAHSFSRLRDAQVSRAPRGSALSGDSGTRAWLG